MQGSGTVARFFLCEITPQGFLSPFDWLYSADDGWNAYVLTGAPGAGKSEVLAKVGSALADAGHRVEYIQSCLNPTQLDAVVFPEDHICILDGAPPRCFYAEFPGVCEHLINLGQFWDEEALQSSRKKILLFSSRIETSADRASRFLSAASSLLADSNRLSMECADEEKLNKYASHLSKREFPARHGHGQGSETRRFLSSVTPDGMISLCDTVVGQYARVFAIDDEFGLGRVFIAKLRAAALDAGFDVITCADPLFPDGKPEHLLIPSLSLAFLSSQSPDKIAGGGVRHIHMRRFLDCEVLHLKRPRISFNRKASRELVNEAVLLLADVRANYEMLKSLYAQAMDYGALEGVCASLSQNILSRFDVRAK